MLVSMVCWALAPVLAVPSLRVSLPVESVECEARLVPQLEAPLPLEASRGVECQLPVTPRLEEPHGVECQLLPLLAAETPLELSLGAMVCQVPLETPPALELEQLLAWLAEGTATALG